MFVRASFVKFGSIYFSFWIIYIFIFLKQNRHYLIHIFETRKTC